MITTRYSRYTCRRCGTEQPDWLIFGAGTLDRPKYYCLNHIPRWVRFRMRLRGER